MMGLVYWLAEKVDSVINAVARIDAGYEGAIQEVGQWPKHVASAIVTITGKNLAKEISSLSADYSDDGEIGIGPNPFVKVKT